VELDNRAVILTEWLEVESYLDTGDRGQFINGGNVVTFPSRVWEAEGSAPLIVTGEKLDAVRRRVMKRGKTVGKETITAARATAAQRAGGFAPVWRGTIINSDPPTPNVAPAAAARRVSHRPASTP
jgi:hypothetical protein